MLTFLFPFLILPTIGGVIGGWLAFDWRIAVATLAGALGIVFLPFSGIAFLTLVALSTGAAVGAVAGLILLWRQDDPSLWTRITWGMIAAFTVHVAHIYWTLDI